MRVKSCDSMSEGSSLTSRNHLICFLYMSRARSTMLLAEELVGKCSNLALIAGIQTQGRGRYGRRWSSPRGGLWFSLLHDLKIDPSLLPFVGLAMAISVVECLKDFGIEAKIKWPNDVIVNDRKICGILIDSKILKNKTSHIIAGVGINVNFSSNILPVELKDKTITLFDILGYKIDLISLLDALTEKYYAYMKELQRENLSLILEKVNTSLYGKGEEVIVYTTNGSFRGKLERIDESGALIISVGKIEYFIDYASVKKLLKL